MYMTMYLVGCENPFCSAVIGASGFCQAGYSISGCRALGHGDRIEAPLAAFVPSFGPNEHAEPKVVLP